MFILFSCGEKRTLEFHNQGILEGIDLDFNKSKDEPKFSDSDEFAVIIYNDKGLIAKEMVLKDFLSKTEKEIELEAGIYNILAFSNKTENVELTNIYNCNTPSIISSNDIEALNSKQPSRIYCSFLEQIVVKKDCTTKKNFKLERISKNINIFVHFTDVNSMYQCSATIYGFASGIDLNNGDLQTSKTINHKAILSFAEETKSEYQAGIMKGSIHHLGLKENTPKKLYLDIYFKDSQKHYFIERDFKEIDNVDNTKDLKIDIYINNSKDITFITKIEVWEEIDLGDIEAK
ncbi:MAG: FimB/Mfa2 family fimbrial subunit [Bacteroidetes bacterium]|nr:FimB/Mfa2 family fimbrial subunit [Bacteroidota bacterium]